MKCWIFILLILCLGCEKSIDLKPESREPLLVVDGTIEDGNPPVIFLSTSLDYFGKINPQILASSLVTNADVTITDGTDTSKLLPYNFPLGGGFNLVFYTTDTLHQATEIRGKQGKRYQLTIRYNNNIFTGNTTIPVLTKTIDSLWWKPAPFNQDSSKVVMMTKVTDPKGFGNYIRYFTRVNNGQFLPGQFSVFDDQVIDGTTYSIQFDQGVDRNNLPSDKDYGYFKRGDTVTVKFTNIDKQTFDFWRTMEFGYSNVGNPFSSPTKVLGNISNNGLGAFCGYSVQYKTLIIPQ